MAGSEAGLSEYGQTLKCLLSAERRHIVRFIAGLLRGLFKLIVVYQ